MPVFCISHMKNRRACTFLNFRGFLGNISLANLESPISRFLMEGSLSLGACHPPHMRGRLIWYRDSSSRLSYLFKSCQVTLIFCSRSLYSKHFWKTETVSPLRAENRFFPWLRQERKHISPGHILVIFAGFSWYDWGFPKFEVLQLWPKLTVSAGSPFGSQGSWCEHKPHTSCSAERNEILGLWPGVFCHHLWNCATTWYYRSRVKTQTLHVLHKFTLLKVSIKTHLIQW